MGWTNCEPRGLVVRITKSYFFRDPLGLASNDVFATVIYNLVTLREQTQEEPADIAVEDVRLLFNDHEPPNPLSGRWEKVTRWVMERGF